MNDTLTANSDQLGPSSLRLISTPCTMVSSIAMPSQTDRRNAGSRTMSSR
jgi:hypothetical protein